MQITIEQITTIYNILEKLLVNKDNKGIKDVTQGDVTEIVKNIIGSENKELSNFITELSNFIYEEEQIKKCANVDTKINEIMKNNNILLNDKKTILVIFILLWHYIKSNNIKISDFLGVNKIVVLKKSWNMLMLIIEKINLYIHILVVTNTRNIIKKDYMMLKKIL